MAGFGEHLIEREVVTREQVERALQAKRLYGGRLGTNLVETGGLDASELTARLSEFLGVPPPPLRWLTERCPKAEAAISRELVARHRVLPLRIEKRTLHLATLDPHEPRLRGGLARAAGLEIELWVLPELRLYSLLGKRYGIRRERNVSLSQLAEQARKRREARTPAAPPAPDPEQEQRAALGIAPLEAGEELVAESFFSDLHAQHMPGNSGTPARASGAGADDDSLFEPIEPPTAVEAPIEAMDPRSFELAAPPATHSDGPLAPARVCALEAALADAPDRATLIDRVLELACTHAEAAALFVLDDGMLAGQRAVVEGEAMELGGILLPCRQGSALAGPVASGEPLRGEPAESGMDPRLLGALGRSEVRQLAMLPIRFGDLTVALLYVDGGSHPIAETSFAALRALCLLASESWERGLRAAPAAIG